MMRLYAPSKLLPRVLMRVLPIAFVILLGSWYVTSTMTARTVERQALHELSLSAKGTANVLRTRLNTIQDAAAALAANDLIRDGLSDGKRRHGYLGPLFQSLQVAGPAGALISLTDSKGRQIATNGKSVSYETVPWLAKVMAGRPIIQISSRGLIVAAPVNAKGSPKGMLVIAYGANELRDVLQVGGEQAKHLVVLGASDVVLHTSDGAFAAIGEHYSANARSGWLQTRAPILRDPPLSTVIAVNEMATFSPVHDVKAITMLTLGLSLIVLVGGIVLAVWLTTKPLSTFASALHGIGDAGDLDRSISTEGGAEFNELARSFNQMIRRLRNTTTSRDDVDNILNSMHEMLFVTDKLGGIELANKAAQLALGYAQHELIGVPIDTIFVDSVALRAADIDDRDVFEAELRTKTGRPLPALLSTSRLDSRSSYDGVIFSALDITELKQREEQLRTQAEELKLEIGRRKEIENALRERELELRTIFDVAADGVVVIDDQGIIQNVNPATEEIFGYRAHELIGSNVKMLMPDPDRSEHDKYIKRHTDTSEPRVIGKNRELYGLRRNGSEFPMELTVSNMWVAGRQLYTGFIRDITQRKEVDNLKNEFVSIVSHELRTPLTSIQGSLGLLRGGVVGELNDKALKIVDIACNNSERLVRLINDILDIEKIESGKLEFDPQPIKIVDLLEEAVALNRSYASQCNVSLALDRSIPNLTIDGDWDRLLQVLSNLISNASKYSPRNNVVTITAARIGDQARISVIDRGPGIPDSFRDTIFSKFAQADGSDSREKGGSGLGLNISKQIIDLHSGTIDFETEIGKGSVFYFELPVLEERPADRVSIAGSGGHVSPRILVCEHDATIAAILKQALNRCGFVVDTAVRGSEVRQALSDNRYAALTLDLELPGVNCAELIREIRDTVWTADLPLVVISARPTEGAETLNGDAFSIIDWIEKPVDCHRLDRAIRRLARRSVNKHLCILHIEDDFDLRELVAVEVGEYGEIIGTPTVREAKHLLKDRVFDAIILDLTLPDGKGEALLSFLGRTVNRGTPVVVLSARDLSGQYRSAVKAALVKSNATHDDLVEIVKSTIEDQTLAIAS